MHKPKLIQKTQRSVIASCFYEMYPIENAIIGGAWPAALTETLTQTCPLQEIYLQLPDSKTLLFLTDQLPTRKNELTSVFMILKPP